MKTCLGVILKNEAVMLERHLPIIVGCFDGAIFLNDGSTDNSEAVIKDRCKIPLEIITQPDGFTGFADKRNKVIKRAEELGYEVMFMLDADECMYPEDINTVKAMSEADNATVIALPRYEFTDLKHYSTLLYPDYQLRVFRLSCGYHYRNPVHEILYKENEEKSVSEQDGLVYAKDLHIYHYGRCKDKNFLWTKDNDYARIAQGLEPINATPPEGDLGVDVFTAHSVEFNGQQPVKI